MKSYLLIALFGAFGTVARFSVVQITIGFLGGFTTFSSFSQDFFNLVNNSNYLLAFIYIFISVFFGLLMFYLGDKFIHIIS